MANVLGLHIPHPAPQYPKCRHLHLFPLLVGRKCLHLLLGQHTLCVFVWGMQAAQSTVQGFHISHIHIQPFFMNYSVCIPLRTVGMHPDSLRFLCFTAVVMVPHIIGEMIR